jgi:hypothetical protein
VCFCAGGVDQAEVHVPTQQVTGLVVCRTAVVSCEASSAAKAELDGTSESSLFGLPNTPNNGFDVVPIRIQGEGSVVGGSGTRTGARLAIVRSTRIKCSAMELFDLLLAVSLERKMNLGSPSGSAKVECGRTALLEANVGVGAPA